VLRTLCTFPYTLYPGLRTLHYSHYYSIFHFPLTPSVSILTQPQPTTSSPRSTTLLSTLLTTPPLSSPSPYHIFNSCGSVDVSWFLRPLPIHRHWRARWTVPSLLFFPFPFLSTLVIGLRPSFHHPSPLQHFSSR
jgi:hypothetical protein